MPITPLFPSRHDAGKMKPCKSEHRKLIVTEAFIVVQTAEQAVDRLAELHERATSALNSALKRYLKDRVEPDAEQRAQFRYPELRLTYHCQGEVPQTTRAYAKVQLPGTYSVTVTHPAAFRKYLLEQLVPLMHDFTVTVEVGVSQQNIPYPYVVEQGDELAGSGVTAAVLPGVVSAPRNNARGGCCRPGFSPGAPPGAGFAERVLRKILPAQGPPASV